jgi:hypothetical protein
MSKKASAAVSLHTKQSTVDGAKSARSPSSDYFNEEREYSVHTDAEEKLDKMRQIKQMVVERVN